VSASNAVAGIRLWGILVFPALFSAGMALLDTADGILMLGAYGWAFTAPRRKLVYNLTITATSALAALVIGLLQGLGLLSERLGLDGELWRVVAQANQHFTLIGISLIGLFALGWGASLLLSRGTLPHRAKASD
jgi:high-affinity nickel-transport protein